MRHIVWVWAIRAAAIALVTTSCSSRERRQTDTNAAGGGATASANQAAPSPARLAQGGSPQPGALTKPLDQYSGDELYTLVHGLTFTGGVERQRRCREAGCAGAQPTQSVQVRIDAVDTQDSLSAQTMARNGVVAARATSRGQGTELMYGMRPGAGLEYYLIVAPAADAQSATWRLVELTTAGGGGQRSHRTLATGAFTECHHPFVRGSRADFKTCAQAATVRPATFGRPFQDSDPPIWISCASGCCTADPGGGHA